MILYYAPGGGLGHLTRGRRVLEALGVDASFVTASPYADDVRVTGGVPVIVIPRELERDVEAHRAWMRELPCERLIVDTFPCGIQGELHGLEVRMDLVARLLRWDEYRRAVPAELPHFETVWQVEELTPEHAEALRAHSSRMVALDLTLGMAKVSPECAPYWLIVHSGPEHEVRELVAYTEELREVTATKARVLVATRCTVPLPDGFTRVDAYPATHLFADAARIISAAGFNVMLDTEPWRAKHHPMPFARTFDDQYRRAARRRA